VGFHAVGRGRRFNRDVHVREAEDRDEGITKPSRDRKDGRNNEKRCERVFELNAHGHNVAVNVQVKAGLSQRFE
jgi:hypothetical protein